MHGSEKSSQHDSIFRFQLCRGTYLTAALGYAPDMKRVNTTHRKISVTSVISVKGIE